MSSLNITLFPNQIRISYLKHLAYDHNYKESYFSFIPSEGTPFPFPDCEKCRGYSHIIFKHLDATKATLNSNMKWNKNVKIEKNN